MTNMKINVRTILFILRYVAFGFFFSDGVFLVLGLELRYPPWVPIFALGLLCCIAEFKLWSLETINDKIKEKLQNYLSKT